MAPYCPRSESVPNPWDGTVVSDMSISKCLALNILLHPNEQKKHIVWIDVEQYLMFAKFPMVFESHHHARKDTIYYTYPPTPALAKAGAAPGTTAGVELLLLSFPRPFASP